MKKKTFSWIFVCLLTVVMCLPSGYAHADSITTQGKCGDNAVYTVDAEGVMRISGNGKVHKFIADAVVKRIIVEDGIEEIGQEGLAGFGEVTEIQLPASVKKVGEWAFRACKNLNKIVFSEGLEEMGKEVFFEDSALKEVELPDTLTKIGPQLFYYCENLKKVKLPKNLKEIPWGIFADCQNLEEIIWPENCKKIGANIFFEANRITSFTVPDSVEYLEEHMLSGADNLKTLVVGKGVTKVKKSFASKAMSLRKIINHSNITIPLPFEKDRRRWYVNGKKVTKLKPGKTAVMHGKKYKVTYNLGGGKAVSKLPKTHTYAQDTVLPGVKKKGYTFLGWRTDGAKDGDNTTDRISKRLYGKISARAILKKCKISSKNGRIHVLVKDRFYGTKKYNKNSDIFYYRYAGNKEMKDAKMVLFTAPYGKGLSQKLSKGTYYVELAQAFAYQVNDYEYDYEEYKHPTGGWIGKWKVVIK